ncbi:cyclic nucleotide-gated channel beta-3 isoform X2 [Hydra vulgaris]|uniref:cyclic nucleotide-gated channel beta-3 isoform X2 n=1 Tax=Hydra vulgaris TaxID=6087 RepID=UPI001F5F1CF3|nr:cyclic nucleotide-gated cation channel beta-3 isoform X2 [Hydra vulgaris]
MERQNMNCINIKSLLATTNSIKKRRKMQKMMFVEKNVFLDKFSTRDRSHSGSSFTSVTPCGSIKSNVLAKTVYINNAATYSGLYYDVKRNCLSEFLLEPYSSFCYFWQIVLLLSINYNIWVVVFRIAYPDAKEFQVLWFSLDYVADLFYLADIFISSRISYIQNGIYVRDKRKVMLAYIKSKKFLIDIITLSPFDILYIIDEVRPVYRLPRLLKFLNIFQAKKVVEAVTNFPNLVRGTFWLNMMFLVLHWNSCFYYIISKSEGFGSDLWVYPNHTGVHKSLLHRYIKCMYWSTLVLTNIGESSPPETTIGYSYMILCYISGMFIFAAIVGQVGNIIQTMNASRMEFERQRDKTVRYMKKHNVPLELWKRVRHWYDYTYSRDRFDGGQDINEIKILPDKIKTELALHVHFETLRKVSFFQKCQPEFLHDLVLKMKLHIFTPGDLIIRKGEIAREMYVISDGTAEVVSESGQVLRTLKPGDFFGEIGLLSLNDGDNRRTANVQSCGYLELFVLSKEDVISSIKDYPLAQNILEQYGRKRLAFGRKCCRALANKSMTSTKGENIGRKHKGLGNKSKTINQQEEEIKYRKKANQFFESCSPNEMKKEVCKDYNKMIPRENTPFNKNDQSVVFYVKTKPNSYRVICFEIKKSIIDCADLKHSTLGDFLTLPIMSKEFSSKRNCFKKQRTLKKRFYKKQNRQTLKCCLQDYCLRECYKENLALKNVLKNVKKVKNNEYFGFDQMNHYNKQCINKKNNQTSSHKYFEKDSSKFSSHRRLSELTDITEPYYNINSHFQEKSHGIGIVNSISDLRKLKSDPENVKNNYLKSVEISENSKNQQDSCMKEASDHLPKITIIKTNEKQQNSSIMLELSNDNKSMFHTEINTIDKQYADLTPFE